MIDHDPLRLDHDAITSTRPADVRDELGHDDAAHAAAAEAAALARDRGPSHADDQPRLR